MGAMFIVAAYASVVVLVGADPADPGIWEIAILSPILAAAAALAMGLVVVALAAFQIIELQLLRALAVLVAGVIGAPIVYVVAALLGAQALSVFSRDTTLLFAAILICLLPVACGAGATLYTASRLCRRPMSETSPNAEGGLQQLDGAVHDIDDVFADDVVRRGVPDPIGLMGPAMAWVAGRLRNNQLEVVLKVAMNREQTLSLFDKALQRIGRVTGRSASGGDLSLTAVVGAGFLKMNPALMELGITDLGVDGCLVRISSTAKEGKIKQRAGEGAIRRVLEAVNTLAPGVAVQVPAYVWD